MFLFEDIAKDFYYCTSIPILVLNKNFEFIFNYKHTKETLSIGVSIFLWTHFR